MLVRIATRQSPLALWQANTVGEALVATNSDVEYELVSIKTGVDKDLSIPISSFAGKGAFSKEVQQLVLADQADIAVHSAKDMQVTPISGLTIAAYPLRGEPSDTLVGSKLEDLSSESVVATGSARRKALISELVPGIHVVELRGNIDTRLAKLDQVDAIIMAECALDRLDRQGLVRDRLDASDFVPQVGQGALAVEARVGDTAIGELCAAIDDQATRIEVETERSFLEHLGGDCDLPAGALACYAGEKITVRGYLSDGEGSSERGVITASVDGQPGSKLAKELSDKLRA